MRFNLAHIFASVGLVLAGTMVWSYIHSRPPQFWVSIAIAVIALYVFARSLGNWAAEKVKGRSLAIGIGLGVVVALGSVYAASFIGSLPYAIREITQGYWYWKDPIGVLLFVPFRSTAPCLLLGSIYGVVLWYWQNRRNSNNSLLLMVAAGITGAVSFAITKPFI